MDDLLAKGGGILKGAENDLRALIQLAVSAGQYDRVTMLASWAEKVASIVGNRSAIHEKTRSANSIISSQPKAVRRRTGSSAKGKKGSRYPTFKRSGGNLVKIGWSKAEKSEYNHQAPKEVAIAILRIMQDKCGDENLVTMDQILPLLTEQFKGELPVYQCYSCVAWLRSIKVIRQHGRRGYSVQKSDEAERALEVAWSELAAYRQ